MDVKKTQNIPNLSTGWFLNSDNIGISLKFLSWLELYLKLFQTFKMNIFAKIVNNSEPFNYFRKRNFS